MERKLTCFIIEDELPAQEVIKKHLSKLPFVIILGTYNNAIDAIPDINNQNPDFIFLDINLPEMTGFEFIRLIKPGSAQIIITTAYSEFALDSYDFYVTDYLLKPISFEKLVRSVKRIAENIELKNKVIGGGQAGFSESSIENRTFAFFRHDNQNERVEFKDISMITAMEDYLKIYLKNDAPPCGFIVVRMTMKNAEANLPTKQFLRISRSVILNMNDIAKLDGNQIITKEGLKLTIGRTYREQTFTRIDEFSI